MSDLKKYIKERKKKDKAFAKGFDEGYEQFKIGVVLRKAAQSESTQIWADNFDLPDG